MADFNGMPLWKDDSPRGGALLYMQGRATDFALLSLESGVEVEVQQGSRALVVRGLQSRDHDAALADALDCAYRALDILAVEGLLVATLADPKDERATWVDIDGEVHLRLWAVITVSLRIGIATVVVRDADGNDITKKRQPPPWHESFRYFRLSQSTDDLHDAFRNMYLALESVLSHIAPQQAREREGEWVRRALEEAAGRVDLSRYAATQGPDESPVEALHRNIYRGIRNAVFHAKSNRPSYLPHDDAAETPVLSALNRLARLYVDLASAALGAEHKSGGVFTQGFKMMTGSIHQDSAAFVSGDSSDPEARSEHIAGEGEPVVRVVLVEAPDLDGPFLTTARATLDMTEINTILSAIARIAVASAAGTSVRFVHTLEGSLHTADIDKGELILGLRGRNSRGLRDYYAT